MHIRRAMKDFRQQFSSTFNAFFSTDKKKSYISYSEIEAEDEKRFIICFALLFAVAQANPGLVAPLTYSAAAVPAYATYAAAPYAAAPYAAYSTYAAPAVATYSHAAYSAPAVATYSHVAAAPAVYGAPVARVAAVAPVAPVTYSAPLVSTLLKKK